MPSTEEQPTTTTSSPSKPVAERVTPITFDDLDIQMEPDTLFEPYMLTQRVRDLEGKQVRITGFMCAGSIFGSKTRQFILLREKECPYGRGGQAHHAIAVELVDQAVPFTTDAVTVEGTFTVQPFTGENGTTWSLYHLEGKVRD
jgi:hypothetical protein